MIRKLRVAVAGFIAAYIPQHLRRPARLSLFGALLEPFNVLETEWLAYRNAGITAAQVTGETASLQWYLNHLYDAAQRRIVLETAPPSGLTAGVEGAEPTLYLVAGIQASEPASHIVAGLPAEAPLFGMYDFIVKRPASINAQDARITKTTNSYRAAGKLFKIIDL